MSRAELVNFVEPLERGEWIPVHAVVGHRLDELAGVAVVDGVIAGDYLIQGLDVQHNVSSGASQNGTATGMVGLYSSVSRAAPWMMSLERSAIWATIAAPMRSASAFALEVFQHRALGRSRHEMDGYRARLPEAPEPAHGLINLLERVVEADEAGVGAVLPIHPEAADLGLGQRDADLARRERLEFCFRPFVGSDTCTARDRRDQGIGLGVEVAPPDEGAFGRSRLTAFATRSAMLSALPQNLQPFG